MRKIFLLATAVLASAPTGVRIANGQALKRATVAPPAATAGSTPTAPVPQAVAEEADRLLRQMGEYIGSAVEFTFHADIIFDHVLPSGQKLQYSASEDVALQRPGGLYIEWSGDLGDRQFWYDGKSVTLYDPATPFYANEAAPADIDAMLRATAAQLGFAPPLSDLLYRNPYGTLRDNLQYGFDLGVNQVAGRNCHTLGFVEKDIDWQIWIDTSPQITPCKLVITYKTQQSQPQFTAIFTEWDFAPRIAAPVFTPEVPPGLEKVPFVKILNPK
jgi:hypothetical protein